MNIFKRFFYLIFPSRVDKLIKRYNGKLVDYRQNAFSANNISTVNIELSRLLNKDSWRVIFDHDLLSTYTIPSNYNMNMNIQSTFENVNGVLYYYGTHMFNNSAYIDMVGNGLTSERNAYNLSSDINIYCNMEGKTYLFHFKLEVRYVS